MEIQEPRITWLGHASFRIDGSDAVIYIDPWQLMGTPQKADIILITHDHHDHCSPDDVSLIQTEDTVIVTVPPAAAKLSGTVTTVAPGDVVTAAGVRITAVPAYNTNKYRSPGVLFHPREARYVGFVVTVDGTRIYHTGDSDPIPEMDGIETDIALVPVSGTYVMTAEEAAEAVERIRPKKAIPMHVGRGIGDMADATRFRDICAVPVTVLSIEN